MSTLVFALVLLAAVLNASWNAIIKVSGDRLSVMAAVTFVGSLISLAALPFVELPDTVSWPFLALTILLHTAYHFLLPQAYSYGPLGQIYPLMRGTAPLLVGIGGALVANEQLTGLPLVGVLCLSSGVVLLSVGQQSTVRPSRKAISWSIATGLSISAYTIVDALGARVSGSTLGFAVLLTLGDGILTAAIVAIARPRALLEAVSRNNLAVFAGGTMQALAYWIAVYALANAPMAMVSSLRETSVLFGALISCFILKEGIGLIRLVSTVLVAAGAMLVKQRS
ncbi:drug/metabolite transporter (DMT)-like permease [Bradyrhizobium sp. USDA 4461]